MNSETFHAISRGIHIATGSVVLVLGMVQLIFPKKGKTHRKLGNIYYLLMLVVFVTSFPAALLSGNIFLASVALFALYLVVSGRRLAKLKNRNDLLTDKLITAGALLTALFLIGLSVRYFVLGAGGFASVPAVFGTIMILMARQDYRFYFQHQSESIHGPLRWHFLHLSRMIGSYIAATTAFLVNARPLGDHWLNWLAPTVVGTLVIILFIRYYQKKFKITH